jgi:hypothetical protein
MKRELDSVYPLEESILSIDGEYGFDLPAEYLNGSFVNSQRPVQRALAHADDNS